MDSPVTKLIQRVLTAMTEAERQRGVAYLNTKLYPPGATIRLDRQVRSRNEPTFLAFIDGQPEANWGHACRYLLLHPTHDGIDVIDGSFPPDTTHLAVVYRSANVQDWMLLTTNVLD